MLLTDAQAAYAGDAALASIYMGDTLVWSSAPPSLYDPATQAFLDATGLDESFAPALDGLVLGLKDAGLWSKMKAVYPFIGGTADLHKWNLMDPRDADDAYRLTFIGSSTSHTQALGYRANPTPAQGGYADTHLVPSTTLDPASVHMALYSLTTMVNAPRCDMGSYNWGGTGGRFHLIVHYTSGEFYYSLGHGGTPSIGQPASGDGSGLYVSSRTDITSETAYRNGAALGSSGIGGAFMPPVPISVGALTTFNSEHSDLPFGFASIGSGLTDVDVAALNTVVEVYQDALGRGTQTWTPASIPGLGAWFDPAQDLYADGERVTTYREHSANQFTYTTQAGAEPIFRTAPRPHFEFTASMFGMWNQATTFNAGLGGLTLVMVGGPLPGTAPMAVVVGPSMDGYEMRFDNAKMMAALSYTTSPTFVPHTTLEDDGTVRLHVIRVDVPRQRTDLWVDEVQVTGAAPTVMRNVPEALYLGVREGGYPYLGTIYEALVFAGPISDPDLASLRGYLKAKHGLAGGYW